MRMKFFIATRLLLSLVVVGSASTALASPEGAAIFKRTCSVCHKAAANSNSIGPTMFGVVGRKAGSVDGFEYSPAMKGSKLTWDAANLEKFLKNPASVVPGSNMTFAGLPAQDIAPMIAYLQMLK